MMTCASTKIPHRIALLVQRQNAKAVSHFRSANFLAFKNSAELRRNATDIIADGHAIKAECQVAIEDYESIIKDVHDQKYMAAVEAMHDLVGQAEKAGAEARDVQLRALAIQQVLQNSAPVLFVLWLVRHQN